MDNFIQALEKCVADKNWYGALFIALTLPDICGKIEYPTKNSSTQRYKDWFERYLEPLYTKQIGAMGMVHKFLSGSDCYALRCALLHEGTDEIGEQRAQEALDRFHFTEPPQSGCIHLNQSGKVLQLQVDKFASEMIQAIRAWLSDVSCDNEKQERLSKLMKVYKHYRF
jgi:hypothetical protein